MNVDLLLEAERRGILPPDKAALLAEARKRGLVTGEAPQAPAQKSIGQTLKENLLGDDDPNTQNFGEKVGSALNKAGEALTFGLIGDEASAAAESLIPGVNYEDRRDHYRQQEEVLERDNPGTALGAEVGGAVLGAVLPFGAIGTLGRGASLGQRVAASTAAGAGMGGVYGFTEGEGLEDRADQAKLGAGVGATVGALTPLVGGAVQKGADYVRGSRAIREAAANAPSSAERFAQGRALYDAIDEAGVQIKPQSFDNARARIMDALKTGTGFDDLPGPGSLTPNSARVMEIARQMSGEMAQEPTAALPFSSLDKLRRQAGAAAGNITNRADQQAGMTVIEGLDDFVQALGPDDVVAGDVKTLQTLIPKAREVWSKASKSQLVDDAIEASDDYLSGGASGIRNQFRRILRSDKLSRGFSDAEKAAMRRVVNGTIPEQMLNLLGGGIGQLAQIGTGFGIGGLPGAAIGMGTAALSRKGSEAITRKNAEIVRALVANGGLDKLPVASDAWRKISESLARRGAAATVQ